MQITLKAGLSEAVLADCKRWADALDSGDYKQGTGALYSEEKNAYCCMGVWQKLNDKPTTRNTGRQSGFPDSTEDPAPFGEYDHCYHRTLFRVTTPNTDTYICPATLNDGYKLTFPEIAKVLRGGTVEH